MRHATIGDRTFRAAGSRPWNGLPNDVVDCQTVDSRYIPSAAETFPFQCLFFMTFRATVVAGLTYAAARGAVSRRRPFDNASTLC